MRERKRDEGTLIEHQTISIEQTNKKTINTIKKQDPPAAPADGVEPPKEKSDKAKAKEDAKRAKAEEKERKRVRNDCFFFSSRLAA